MITAVVALLLVWPSLRVIAEYERGIVLRFGRVLPGTRGPGLALLAPVADRLRRVDVQIITLPVPAQVDVTRENVGVTVDAAVHFRVVDPVKIVVDVEDRPRGHPAGRPCISTLDRRQRRPRRSSGQPRTRQPVLERLIDNPADGWCVRTGRVEIKDIAPSGAMRRSVSREAEPERRSRSITAEGERRVSQKAGRRRRGHDRTIRRRAAPHAPDLLRSVERGAPSEIDRPCVATTRDDAPARGHQSTTRVRSATPARSPPGRSWPRPTAPAPTTRSSPSAAGLVARRRVDSSATDPVARGGNLT